MTIDEKREILSQYRELDIIINQQLDEVSRLLSLATKCTQTLNDSPGGDNDRSNIYIKLIAAKEKVNETIDEYVDLKRRIDKAIDKLPDLTLQIVLNLKYKEGKTYEEIAEELECSVRNVYKLMAKALEAINL
jgi:RNA polymerase sigma factor (sigma-70 family)